MIFFRKKMWTDEEVDEIVEELGRYYDRLFYIQNVPDGYKYWKEVKFIEAEIDRLELQLRYIEAGLI